jgi:RNA polymerase sigma-70 factor (ECF subfamily)
MKRPPVLALEEIIERARAGDAMAFESLVRAHVPRIRRIAFAFCRTQVDADDLAQDALLKAYRSLHTFREGTFLGPWLYSVTRSVCHDWYRQSRGKGRPREVELDEERELAADPSEFDQQQLLLVKDDAERLWAAIRTLEPTFRVPLVLFDIEGLSYEEIARVEQIPVGTVRSRLSRARQRLAALLGEADSDSLTAGTYSGPASSPRLRGVR